jgi:hypothetical protein
VTAGPTDDKQAHPLGESAPVLNIQVPASESQPATKAISQI